MVDRDPGDAVVRSTDRARSGSRRPEDRPGSGHGPDPARSGEVQVKRLFGCRLSPAYLPVGRLTPCRLDQLPSRGRGTSGSTGLSSIPFFLVHVLCFAVIFTGITATAVVLFVVMFFGRAFFVTAAYHRYFSHKSYKLNRFWQFVFAFMAPRRPRRRACCGGRRTTGTTTATRTPTWTSTRRARASGGATSAGSSPTSTRPPTTPRSRTSRKYPELRSAQQARLDRAVGVRHRRVPDRRLARSRRRVLLVDGAAVAHARSS